MSFEDNRVAVKNALHDAGVAFLHEAAGELEAKTKRNVPSKGLWFTQQKNAWRHEVDEGKMEAVVEKYCEETLAEFNTPDKTVAFITHTSATPEMVSRAKAALEQAGFETIYDTVAGGTITSHCGEHVLGILYFNDGKKI